MTEIVIIKTSVIQKIIKFLLTMIFKQESSEGVLILLGAYLTKSVFTFRMTEIGPSTLVHLVKYIITIKEQKILNGRYQKNGLKSKTNIKIK